LELIKKKIRQGIADVWDSGKISSNKSWRVSYGGSPMEPGKEYYWTVKVWDKDAVASPFSKPARFLTAIKDIWTDGFANLDQFRWCLKLTRL
jgi:hypothetical protein